MKPVFQRHELAIARIAIIMLYLALIRCIGEFFRLEASFKENLTIAQVKPFLLGALTAAAFCLIMTILYFYSKYKFIPAFAIIGIISLIFIKIHYKI